MRVHTVDRGDAAADEAYRWGDFVICPGRRQLLRAGAPVDLEAKVFDLIVLLLRERERAVGKQQIIEALWGPRPVTDTALSQLLYKARRALDDDGERQQAIRTVHGRGLQWVAPVTPVADEPERPPPTVMTTPRSAPVRRRWWLVAALLPVLAALALWLVPRDADLSGNRLPRLAILPVSNNTGDPALDWTRHGLPGLIAGLMGQTRGIDMVDPLQVARLESLMPPPGRDDAAQARFATGADILVHGQLRRIDARRYQLDLQVQRAPGQAASPLAVTGEDPGKIGIEAATQIRQQLGLPAPAPASPAAPHDSYLAQTYARGIAQAMGGDWAAARPYFALVAKGDPTFLPGRLRLGQAQVGTDQHDAGEATLSALLDTARQGHDGAAVAQTLYQLGNLDLIRHRNAQALARLHEAMTFARRARLPEMQAAIALKGANAAARLKRPQQAEQSWRLARQLIADNQLHRLEADLYNSQAFLADARGDLPAKEAADRATLAASEALGDQRNIRGDTYNIALDLMRQERATQALPMFARVYTQARANDDAWLAFAAGDQQARILLDAGVTERVEPLARQLLEIAGRQRNAVWKSLALMLQAGRAWYDGDAAAALARCREAAAQVDGAQDPALLQAIRESEAAAALQSAPGAVAAIAADSDALVRAQPRPDDFRYVQQLIRALAAAAAGQADAARTALQSAAAQPASDDPGHTDLRYVGLTVALATRDARAAAVALDGFDPARENHADILRLYRTWAKTQSDAAGAARAAERLVQLRASVSAALEEASR